MAEIFFTTDELFVNTFIHSAEELNRRRIRYSLKCIVYNEGACPLNDSEEPSCGHCSLARHDQEKVVGLANIYFPLHSVPQEEANTLIATSLVNTVGEASIIHKAGIVIFEYQPKSRI